MSSRSLLCGIVGVIACGLLASCGSSDRATSVAALSKQKSSDRKVVQWANLSMAVGSVEEASPKIQEIVKGSGGFVESSTILKGERITLECRVPAMQLESVMDAVSRLGDAKRRSMGATDVTDAYADLETRLKNSIAFRERLQGLLGRAKALQDVIAIEKELNRIQSDIETMQGEFDRLKTKVDLSSLEIELYRKQILGPLGWVAFGIWWLVSKLFVIR
jgi:hypothetical protein